jgi:hypothetical protein
MQATPLTAEADVRNTGKVAGDEVAAVSQRFVRLAGFLLDHKDTRLDGMRLSGAVTDPFLSAKSL